MTENLILNEVLHTIYNIQEQKLDIVHILSCGSESILFLGVYCALWCQNPLYFETYSKKRFCTKSIKFFNRKIAVVLLIMMSFLAAKVKEDFLFSIISPNLLISNNSLNHSLVKSFILLYFFCLQFF